MEFYRPKSKTPTVSIVPLIDILVTLLFFFIVTMQDLTEKTPQPETKVALPSAHSLEVKVTEEVRTTLSLSAEGRAELDGLPIPRGLLKEHLVANLQARPGMKLAIRADRACPFEVVLMAHSAALEAGYLQKDIYYPVERPAAAAEKKE